MGLWVLETACRWVRCIVVWISSYKDPKPSCKGTFVDGFAKPTVLHHMEFEVKTQIIHGETTTLAPTEKKMKEEEVGEEEEEDRGAGES